MPSIDVPFHALPREIGIWLREWIDREHIYVVSLLSIGLPFEARQVEPSEVESAVMNDRDWMRRLSLLIRPPDLTAKFSVQGEYMDKHSDQLILDVGQMTSEGLYPSGVSCRTDDQAAFKIWQRIARNLKKKTKAGIRVIDRETGASGDYRNHRYSEGAKALQSQGIAILPLVGQNRQQIRLGDSERGA
jgi:hypothetical protein